MDFRPALLTGNQFNQFIPKSNCQRTDLGSGDTFFTVSSMREWVKKYHSQAKRIAPILKGATVEKTVENIHSFLYQLLAYKADGPLQVIKSPACAWSTRDQGTDCKTFSVFASAILSELRINHAIRQVKQPTFHPDLWTHVYVVVPKNQNSKRIGKDYFVLDGTKMINTEVSYSEKNDEFMDLQHIGLACASTTGVTPGIIPHHKRRPVLPKPHMKNCYRQFMGYLNMLYSQGLPAEYVQKIKHVLDSELAKGKDPVIELSENGIGVEGKRFMFPVGLMGPGAVVFKKKVGDFLKNAGKKVIQKIGAWVKLIFSKIIGFFQCIGSSTNPKKSEELIKVIAANFWERPLRQMERVDSLNTAELARRLSKASKDLAVMEAYFRFHADESRECGRKANTATANFVQKLEDQMVAMLNAMKEFYVITPKRVPVVASREENHAGNITHHWKGKTITTHYNQYTMRVKPGAIPPDNPIPSGTTKPGTDPVPKPKPTPPKPRPTKPAPNPTPTKPAPRPAPRPLPRTQPDNKKAGVGVLPIALIAGVALKALL